MVSKVDVIENELRSSLHLLHRNDDENKNYTEILSTKLMNLEETRGKEMKELFLQTEKLNDEVKSHSKYMKEEQTHNTHIEEKMDALSVKYESLQRQISEQASLSENLDNLKCLEEKIRDIEKKFSIDIEDIREQKNNVRIENERL